jgi:hypothetical protein
MRMGGLLGARMLDGQRYFAEFPDEVPEASDLPRKLLLSDELRVTLAAIEKELSDFMRGAGRAGGVSAADHNDSVSPRDSAET